MAPDQLKGSKGWQKDIKIDTRYINEENKFATDVNGTFKKTKNFGLEKRNWRSANTGNSNVRNENKEMVNKLIITWHQFLKPRKRIEWQTCMESEID